MEYGLILDLETTGLDASKDEIIEIGVLLIGFEEGGHQARILKSYGALSEPKAAISAEITKITGIRNEDLIGQHIDWELVQGWVSQADIIIAHNARFDRGFLRRRSELSVDEKHWACSLNHIDWRQHGYQTSALNYLAADHGFINPFAHRAIFDCATTFRLIEPYLPELIDNSFAAYHRVTAVGAPFESKDVLRSRGYRWDPEQKAWWKSLMEKDLACERDFLTSEVYKGTSRHREEVEKFWETA